MFRTVSLFLLTIVLNEYVVGGIDMGGKFNDMAKMLHKTCVERHGIEQAQIDAVLQGDFNVKQNMKDYITCLWLESTAMDNTGNMDWDFIDAMVSGKNREEYLTTLHICVDKTEGLTNPHTKVWTLTQCFYKERPDLFIMF